MTSIVQATTASSTLQSIEQWEEAWSDYILALDMGDAEIVGEDAVYWAGIAGRRLDEAKRQLRHLNPDFCKSLGI